jgi:hypothetical protein
MRANSRKNWKHCLRVSFVFLVAGSALMGAGCQKRKDGVIVETSDRLEKAGVVIRDWRRSGLGTLDVQIFSQTEIPANSWTLAAYDKAGTLLTSGRVLGPRARVGDTVWIRASTPYRDLFDKADRVVIGVNVVAPSP